MPEFEIVPYSKEEAIKNQDFFIDIAEKTFGDSYISNIGKDFFSHGNTTLFVARTNNKIVGFSYGFLAHAGELSDILRNKESDIPDFLTNMNKNGEIGIIKIVAVHPQHQKHGIGTALTNHIESTLKNIGARIIIVPAWRGRSGVNIHKIMQNQEYKTVFSFDGYWKKSCDMEEFKCIDRRDHCICGIVFYQKLVGKAVT